MSGKLTAFARDVGRQSEAIIVEVNSAPNMELSTLEGLASIKCVSTSERFTGRKFVKRHTFSVNFANLKEHKLVL